MSNTSTQSLDYIELLNLENELSPVELVETMNTLSAEVWYRILAEKLPRLLNQEETKKLLDLSKDTADLSPVLSWLKENRRDIRINPLIEETALEVKNDFILSYLHEMKQTYIDREDKSKYLVLVSSIDKLIALLQSENANAEEIRISMTQLVKQKEDIK